MSSDTTNEALNRLLVLHTTSVPLYLLDAAPWTQPGGEHALEVVRSIAEDQRETAARLAELITENGATPESGDFPLMFTCFNDLSLEFLVREMIRRTEDEIREIEACVEQLSRSPLAKAVAEESLGAAKAHLDMLRDLTAQPVL